MPVSTLAFLVPWTKAEATCTSTNRQSTAEKRRKRDYDKEHLANETAMNISHKVFIEGTDGQYKLIFQ